MQMSLLSNALELCARQRRVIKTSSRPLARLSSCAAFDRESVFWWQSEVVRYFLKFENRQKSGIKWAAGTVLPCWPFALWACALQMMLVSFEDLLGRLRYQNREIARICLT